VPVVVLLSLTLPHLGQGTWQSDSALYSALGLQGLRTGHLWSLLTEPGVPYFKKPPLPLWIHGLSLHLFGATLWASRVPTVLAACGCVLAMVAIARTMLGRWTSLWCGLVLALTYDFFHQVGRVSLDVWQLLFMMIAVAMAARGVAGNRAAWLVWAGVPLGLALMCKPFMALLAVPLLAIWFVAIGRARWLGWLVATTLIACAVAAPWHLSMYATYGQPFVDEYLGHEVVERAKGNVLPGHSAPVPVWFYLELLAARYWPWIVPAAATLVLMAKRRMPGRDPRLAVLAIMWSAGWLIALSAFPDRRDRYDVPIFVGTSILAAMWLAGVSPARLRRWLRIGTRLAPAAFPVLGIALALAPVRIYSVGNGQWPRLGAWADQNHPTEFWNGGAGLAQCGETYLVTGVWPRSEGESAHPGPGSLILYHATGGVAPGPGETLLFEHADVKVTRLEGSAWQPIKTNPARSESPEP
jgi:4-amino-4-deoxy-L-arabinose transferase-like glycosyltransferase